MSYTLSAQKDVHVDSKKDMHVDYSDLFLQIDKRLSEVTGNYCEKSLSPPVKMVLLTLPRDSGTSRTLTNSAPDKIGP